MTTSTPSPDHVPSQPEANPQQEASHEASIWQGDPVNSAPVNSAPAPTYYQPPTSGNAIVALVLSIVSWFILPLVLAIVALVFARKAEREIAGSQLAGNQARLGGGNLITAAKILAWINIGFFTALIVLAIFAIFFLMLAGVASS